MDVTEDDVTNHNYQTIQKCMDILGYFANRIQAVDYYPEHPAEWRQKTVFSIHSVENNPDPDKGHFRFIDTSSPHYSGEMLILIDIIGLDLQGLYKGAFTCRTLCSLRSTPPVLIAGKSLSEVYIVFNLEYVNDSFPLHEKAIRVLKQQLRLFIEGIGLSVPANLMIQ